jgi:hypothetical protein
MHEPASVYLDANRRLEEQSQQLRDLGVMLSAVGAALSKDWKELALAGEHAAQLSRDFAHPKYPQELNLDTWPDAASLADLLASAHHTLAEVTAAWQAIPREWRSMLPPPPAAVSETRKQERVA